MKLLPWVAKLYSLWNHGSPGTVLLLQTSYLIIKIVGVFTKFAELHWSYNLTHWDRMNLNQYKAIWLNSRYMYVQIQYHDFYHFSFLFFSINMHTIQSPVFHTINLLNHITCISPYHLETEGMISAAKNILSSRCLHLSFLFWSNIYKTPPNLFTGTEQDSCQWLLWKTLESIYHTVFTSFLWMCLNETWSSSSIKGYRIFQSNFLYIQDICPLSKVFKIFHHCLLSVLLLLLLLLLLYTVSIMRFIQRVLRALYNKLKQW